MFVHQSFSSLLLPSLATEARQATHIPGLYRSLCCPFKALSVVVYPHQLANAPNSFLFQVAHTSVSFLGEGWGGGKVDVYVGTFECEAEARRFFSNC